MDNEIKIGKKIYIRNAGKDEYWLQDIIYENPERLGLGNLIGLGKERKQSTGGRLDILLKDPNDNTMYEVEIMLGSTDPSHIIRSIEYWDNEKRKYPQRQHFVVLIAESFDRRYFNVIQILSLNVPMIAIQADLLQVGNEKVLHFTKILDVYEEPEYEEETAQATESTWSGDSKWTLEVAKKYFELINDVEKNIDFRFTQSYISITVNGKNCYYFNKRTKPNSVFWFNVKEEEKVDTIKQILDKNGFGYTYNKYKNFILTIDKNFINKNKGLLLKIHEIKHKEFNPADD